MENMELTNNVVIATPHTALNRADNQVKAVKSEPKYTVGEEILNVITHGVGALFGIFIIIFGLVRGAAGLDLLASFVFGISMIITYSISAVYHGLKPSKAKRVLRVIDHCTVYLLIIGTYTGVVLSSVAAYSPLSAILMLVVQWSVGILAIVLTAVDMKKYAAFSFVCYIALGWCIIVIPHIIIGAMTLPGFAWLLAGGIAYTVGSVLYGIGHKKRYMHGIFHIFCLVGSVLQFVSFALYCI